MSCNGSRKCCPRAISVTNTHSAVTLWSIASQFADFLLLDSSLSLYIVQWYTRTSGAWPTGTLLSRCLWINQVARAFFTSVAPQHFTSLFYLLPRECRLFPGFCAYLDSIHETFSVHRGIRTSLLLNDLCYTTLAYAVIFPLEYIIFVFNYPL